MLGYRLSLQKRGGKNPLESKEPHHLSPTFPTLKSQGRRENVGPLDSHDVKRLRVVRVFWGEGDLEGRKVEGSHKMGHLPSWES